MLDSPLAAEGGERGVADGGVEDLGGKPRVGHHEVLVGQVAGKGIAQRGEVRVREAGVGGLEG